MNNKINLYENVMAKVPEADNAKQLKSMNSYGTGSSGRRLTGYWTLRRLDRQARRNSKM